MVGSLPESTAASGCREWDCAGIPHQLAEVVAAVAAAVAGTEVVRVVLDVVVDASAAAAEAHFESSWTNMEKFH